LGFGDETTSTDLETSHIYQNTGDYTVVNKIVNGKPETLLKKIGLYNTDYIYNPIKLVQCDTQDTNPTDGLSLFNLELANDAICLGNEDYEVFYYHSTIDAENDLNNTESIRPTYRNEVPDEVLYAK
jgi:hypothetical protein